MCTELITTSSAIQKKLVWVRYLLGTEPEGMILHNTKILNYLAHFSPNLDYDLDEGNLELLGGLLEVINTGRRWS